ncbi:MAG: hypothetical protein IJQ56_08165 [Synergistaceae bacterium]|nr:hypothetical protein [Synergistaceae bacterium]
MYKDMDIESRVIKIEQQVSELHDMLRVTNKEMHSLYEAKSLTGIFVILFLVITVIVKIFRK